jgi:hypothetical protein
VQLASDAALGSSANDLLINGILRVTNNVSLGSGRDVSGSGTYDIADVATLTVAGNFSNTTTIRAQPLSRSRAPLGVSVGLTQEELPLDLVAVTRQPRQTPLTAALPGRRGTRSGEVGGVAAGRASSTVAASPQRSRWLPEPVAAAT